MDPILAEIYGTAAADETDVEKVAAAEMAAGLAEGGELDLASVDPEYIEALAAQVLGDETEETEEELEAAGGEGGEEGGEEAGEVEAEEPELDEQTEKIAEADFLGRVMAHALHQESREIEKQAGVGSALKRGAAVAGMTARRQGRDVVEGFKGLGTMARSPREAAKAAKGMYQAGGVKGVAKGLKNEGKALAVGAAGVGAAGVGAKAAFGKKKEAGVKDMAGKVGGALKSGGRRYAELMKGGIAGAGNSRHGFSGSTKSEAFKSLGARAGTAAAAAGAGVGAKKAMEKKSSALDTLAEQRAIEWLLENGYEFQEQETEVEKEAGVDEAELLSQAVDARAFDMLVEAGFIDPEATEGDEQE